MCLSSGIVYKWLCYVFLIVQAKVQEGENKLLKVSEDRKREQDSIAWDASLGVMIVKIYNQDARRRDD